MDRKVVVFFHYMIGVWFCNRFITTKKSDFFSHFTALNANKGVVYANSTAG